MKRKTAMVIPDWIILFISLVWIVGVIWLIVRTASITITYLTIAGGIFLSLCFGVISFKLIQNQLPYGIYAGLCIVSILLILQQFNYEFLLDSRMHNFGTVGIFSLLGIIALVKLWDLLSSEEY